MNLLSIFSQLQVPFVLKKLNLWAALFWMYLLEGLAIVLSFRFDPGYNTSESRTADNVASKLGIFGVSYSLFIITGDPLFWLVRTSLPLWNVVDRILKVSKYLSASPWSQGVVGWVQSLHRFVHSPLAQFAFGFLVCGSLTLFYAIRALQMKFDTTFFHECNMTSTEEDRWTQGQTFAVFMLAALFLPAADTFFGQ